MEPEIISTNVEALQQPSPAPSSDTNQPAIRWHDFEYDYTEKHPDWFWYLGIITLLAVIICILVKNFLLAIILILGAFSMAMYAKEPPKELDFEIDGKGVRAGSRFYNFRFIKSFWVQLENERRELIIETDRFYLPFVILPLGNVDPDQVRNFLLNMVPEEERADSFSRIIFEFFGF